MKAALITHRGFEKAASDEITARISKQTKQQPGIVLFNAPARSVLELAYSSQSAIRIIALIEEFSFKDFSADIKKVINKHNFFKWVDKKESFAVSSLQVNSSIPSQEINGITGEKIIEHIKLKKGYKQAVSLENPDVLFFLYINNNRAYFGIDVAGFDLSKREYKIFSHASSLRGTIAFCMLMESGYNKGKVMIDPFCGSGMIPIEAALFACNFSPNYYKKDKFLFRNMSLFSKIDSDKLLTTADSKRELKKRPIYGHDLLLHPIKSTQKNAKIAGISKQFTCSRVEVEWLDTKYSKNSADIIVTHPPFISKRTSKKAIEKIYDQLFYCAKFILKDDGNLTVLINSVENLMQFADKYNFNLKRKHDVYQGEEKLEIAVFIKK